MSSARDALDWMNLKMRRPDSRVLFRGQNRVYPTIKPSMARLNAETMVEMWNVCRRFHTAANGITGYSVPSGHDRLAILQHYVGSSPVIDLTGNPTVALYFALRGVQVGNECVVYSIDQSACDPEQVVFADHEVLLLQPQDGGLQHRWLKQDGYSVAPRKWPALDAVRNFDLLNLSGVESKSFIKAAGDDDLTTSLADLEDISSDPLARAVRATVVAVAESLNLLIVGRAARYQ